MSSVTSSTPHLQGQTPATGVPTFTKGALPGVRLMYPPPSSSATQSTGPVPTYPAPTSSAYGPPGMIPQGTPSVVQPGSVPTYPPSVSTPPKSQQYPAPLSSKPAQAGPEIGNCNAPVTSNYTRSLSDGFNSMNLQVCLFIIVISCWCRKLTLELAAVLVATLTSLSIFKQQMKMLLFWCLMDLTVALHCHLCLFL